MVLILFYAEDLQRFVIDAIRATDRISSTARIGRQAVPERVLGRAKRPFQKALAAFVADGVLDDKAKSEIVRLVDYRNDIAHRIHQLTGDIGRTSISRNYVDFREANDPRYDYDALGRLRFYRSFVEQRARSQYVITIGISRLLFEPMEKSLESELARLRRSIDRQVQQRKRKDEKLLSELSLAGVILGGKVQPRDPENQDESGRLTKRGVEICYRLFDAGKSPLAVAYLMDISLRAARQRERLWRALGGLNRQVGGR